MPALIPPFGDAEGVVLKTTLLVQYPGERKVNPLVGVLGFRVQGLRIRIPPPPPQKKKKKVKGYLLYWGLGFRG